MLIEWVERVCPRNSGRMPGTKRQVLTTSRLLKKSLAFSDEA